MVLPAAILSIWYILKPPFFKPLRQYPLVKSFTIALVWALTIWGLPGMLIFNEVAGLFTLRYLGFFGALFFLFLSEAITFDLRDLEIDWQVVRTIPAILGKTQTILLIMCLLISSLVCMILAKPQLPFLIAWLITISYYFIFYFGLIRNRSHWYYSLWLDAGLFLPFLSYWSFTILIEL